MTPICGAKAKRTGKPCQLYPCKNGRCYLHGGKSTGIKTQEGKERQRAACLKHGLYTKEAKESQRKFREFMKLCRETINEASQTSSL